jgi:hypothetical protein
LNDTIRTTAILMLLTSILTLFTALKGIFYSQMYMDLVLVGALSSFAAAGAVNQDLLSGLCGLVLFVLSLILLKSKNYKLLIIALGLVGYIFYGYAIYTFGVLLTPLYLVYIATFTLSVYCLIMGIASFSCREVVNQLRLGKGVRTAIGVFLFAMSTVLSLKWISDILLTRLQAQPELYLVAAMDLGVALPAIGVSAVMIAKNKGYGILLSGIALIKTFTLCLSVAIGTFIAPYFDLPADYDTFCFFTVLAVVSLVLTVIYIRGISVASPQECK